MITKFHTVPVMRTVLARATWATLLGATVLAGCGGGAERAAGPHVVVTTSILGDVVQHLVGDAADVTVVMPPGTDPHDAAPSPRQAAGMRDADVLVVNGLGFEAALVDTIRAAQDDGATVVTATDAIDPRPLASDGTAGGGALDPHFVADPVAMRAAASHIAEELGAHVDGLDTPEFRARVADYLRQLDALDAEVRAILAPVPAERRRLVTNHEVFGYFAARYDFEVLGAVLPGGSTLAEPSAADLRRLATTIRQAGVPAIFADTSSPTRLADALAAEGADVDVVPLYSEALGEPGSDGGTYIDMVRTNATRIAHALETP
jgi:zinc/manganese transport system substrate-binding protein